MSVLNVCFSLSNSHGTDMAKYFMKIIFQICLIHILCANQYGISEHGLQPSYLQHQLVRDRLTKKEIGPFYPNEVTEYFLFPFMF